MGYYLINDKTLSDIADAIRAKKGSDETILTENFASEIEALDNKVLKELIQRSITEINIPEGTANIGYCAFYNCRQLKSITIPESVTIISQSALYGCQALKDIKLPKNLVYIGDLTFANCSSCLTYDFSECAAIPSLGGTGVFNGKNANSKIVVPENLYDDFCRHASWGALQGSLVSIAKVEQNEEVPLETVWILGEGEYRYVPGVSASLKAFYKINDGDAVEFDYYNPAFGCLQFTQMYDGDTGYTLIHNGSPLYFTETGTYEIWVENEDTGEKYYRRVIEVTE